MKSRLLHLAVGLSLVLFVGTVILWARGYFARDGIWYSTDTGRYSLHSYRGRIWFWSLSGGRAASDSVWNTPAKLDRGIVWDSTPDSYYDQFRGSRKWNLSSEQFTLAVPATGFSSADPGAVDWRALGFRYLRNRSWTPIAQLQQGYPTAQSSAVFIPHWAMVLTFGILPTAMLFRAARRRHRIRRGLCPVCGYDLRASPTRCPECGTIDARGRPPAE
jgi:hypothetical protein